MDVFRATYRTIFQILLEVGKIWLFLGMHAICESVFEKIVIGAIGVIYTSVVGGNYWSLLTDLVNGNVMKEHLFRVQRLVNPAVSKDLGDEQDALDKSKNDMGLMAIAHIVFNWGNLLLLLISTGTIIFSVWPNLRELISVLSWLG